METKFYAPRERHWLTVTQHPGKLMEDDILEAIVRMQLMSKEEVSAEEALEMMDEMDSAERSRLTEEAAWPMYEPEMQDYLSRKGIYVGMPLHLQEDPDEVLEYLDEMTWEGLELWELPTSEMD